MDNRFVAASAASHVFLRVIRAAPVRKRSPPTVIVCASAPSSRRTPMGIGTGVGTARIRSSRQTRKNKRVDALAVRGGFADSCRTGRRSAVILQNDGCGEETRGAGEAAAGVAAAATKVQAVNGRPVAGALGTRPHQHLIERVLAVVDVTAGDAVAPLDINGR